MLKITYKAKKTRKREKERKTGRPRERERLTRVNVRRKERWERYAIDGHNSRRREDEREGSEGEKQLSSCPSPHAARTPPWGDSDFKPLPCFIFPWLLQPDQSS